MRQKYLISREDIKNELKIREYAILQKALKTVDTSMPSKEKFTFLCEETYDGATVVGSIDRGLDALVATLRTHNLFPIKPYAIRIAESVIELYDTEGDHSVELFFDDVELFEKKPIL